MLQHHSFNRVWTLAASTAIALGVSFHTNMTHAATTEPVPPAAPTTAPQPAPENLQVTVTGIEGMVQVRTADTEPWQPVKLGMTLDQGAEFRTGPRSAVRFVIPPDQTITLDRLGTVKVLQAVRDHNKLKTDLGMKYGRTRYDIEAAGLDHAGAIRSPGSTLAIRGTKVSLYDQAPFDPEARSLTGQAVYTDAHHYKTAVGSNKPTILNSKNSTPGDTANASTAVDTRSNYARTEADNIELLSLRSYGGSDFRDLGVLAFLEMSKRGQFSGSLIGTLPVGQLLDFRLTWTGSPGSDVDLTVISPKGEVLSNANPSVPSSGVHGPNGVADSNGVGQESATWTVSFPPGNYTVKADLVSGVNANVNIFAVRDPLGEGALIGNLTGTLTPGSPTFTGTVKAKRH